MDRVKVFKNYFVSSQNTVLIPNSDFGRRKFLNVGINRSLSTSRIEELAQNHTDEMRAANKQWIHPPDTLLRGHILYNVKFLGESEVEAPKGTDVVKDAIRKRKFNKHIKKAEGRKTPKVELSISADGVIVQEPKSKFVLHQYPLHRISYCADDKSDKRMFTFIAKGADTSQHYCYVFASEKCLFACENIHWDMFGKTSTRPYKALKIREIIESDGPHDAEEITLTIGQAFDLAYRRFLDTQGKDMDSKKQQQLLQKRIQTLEKENKELKQRIQDLENMKDRSDVDQYKQSNGITDMTSIAVGTVVMLQNAGESTTDSPHSSQPGSPKLNAVGRRLENLVFEEGQPQLNGTSNHNMSTNLTPGILSPPPPSTRPRASSRSPHVPSTPSKDMSDDLSSVFTSPVPTPRQQDNNHAFNPFAENSGTGNPASDPFGMGSFTPTGNTPNNGFSNKQEEHDFLDLQAGFNQGLSFGTEDFNMDDFDPLNQSK